MYVGHIFFTTLTSAKAVITFSSITYVRVEDQNQTTALAMATNINNDAIVTALWSQ
jgi:hypothetical protein